MGRMIDVREYPDFAAGHVMGATQVPLRRLAEESTAWNRSHPLTMVCKSGRRAEQARGVLIDLGFTCVDVLEGGMDAWRAAGRPVQGVRRPPWSMERQVRTVAGSLVVITLALGYFVSRYFLLGTTLVGAGLVFAGVSDTCMMGLLLARLPWNRKPQAAALMLGKGLLAAAA